MESPLVLGTLSFFIAVIWGQPLMTLLKHYRIGKQVRIEGPDSHQEKTGTPTMGGLLFVVPVLLITGALNLANLLGFDLIGQSTLLLFFCLAAHATLGAGDDWLGLRGRGKGMSARMKSGFQFVFAAIIVGILYYGPPNLYYVGVPGIPEWVAIGWLFIPAGILIIIGFSNAVNLTDGLDSLAGSISGIAFASYGLIAHLQGQAYLAAFCFTMVGALFAFLWFNAHPAQVFMGDTGSLALGATLALVALMTGQWLLLPVVGFVFVAETVSVLLQVASAKLSRRYLGRDIRLFKMTPIHHHFELLGWSETQVKERFWIVGVLSGMLGVALALWNG
ncbi:MAG: phospho-N-acetylmuramoyl-pentapeptide-transferase [Caldilineaceae bacterium SB0670_bin_27]|nr:phospho-N-acetylmuramoyl-pentapeptide-transferase [Caldilineaceae bacterium SB0670_bin_27]